MPEYQCQVAPAESVPDTVIVDDAPAEQIEDGNALTDVAADGVGFTFTLVLLQFEKHPLFSART